ncbi:MAG: AlkA N-terminal domain-containing protein [Bacillota bacterium]|nr:AlkA N-terminal domain-containing protein [Bacillota bacterium]
MTDLPGLGPEGTLRLACRPPFDWTALVGFLGPRATPGIEWARDTLYRRTFRAAGQAGVLEVRHEEDQGCIEVVFHLGGDSQTGEMRDEVAARLRRLFDVDTDPAPIAERLSEDPFLRPAVAARPGLRVPGAWDGFELAVRAILGQQVSVAAATTLAGRLVRTHGEVLPAPVGWGPPGDLRFFPRPEVLAASDLRELGLPGARAAAISSLAAAVAADSTLIAPEQDAGMATRRLTTLPGIGPWTAQYIAMRWFRDADAFPASDLGLRRSAAGKSPEMPTPAALAKRAEAWQPYRAYAAMHLWAALAST